MVRRTLLPVALNKYLPNKKKKKLFVNKTAIFPNEILFNTNLYGNPSCWLVSWEARGEREEADYNWCIALAAMPLLQASFYF